MTPPSPLAGEGRLAEGERGEGGDLYARTLLTRARAMRRQPTDAERALWRILRGRRLSGFKFRHQVPIGPYIADFLSYEHRHIIEADGGQHGENAYDERRTAWLNAQGFRVMRFWNAEILTEPERIAQAIYLALTDPSPRSLRESPFPARGEGWSAHAR